SELCEGLVGWKVTVSPGSTCSTAGSKTMTPSVPMFSICTVCSAARVTLDAAIKMAAAIVLFISLLLFRLLTYKIVRTCVHLHKEAPATIGLMSQTKESQGRGAILSSPSIGSLRQNFEPKIQVSARAQASWKRASI